jgi:isoleucyl-tRNA synthetase
MAEETLPQLEERILRFWKDRGIFEKTLKARKRGRPFRFFEGPPTANASPGIHHVLSRIFKDIICRYKTMRGFLVERKAGWDTHGLPVELQIEKELGITHKSEIEKFGIAEFNKKAKESVWRYKEEWERFTERIGFWLDLAHPYITYDASYMESLWWVIRQFWKRGLLEEDYKVVPYCPRCETPLSSHEVAQGYETVRDPSVFVRLKLKRGKANPAEYLLVWTTTPWTLPANVAVAVHPSSAMRTIGAQPRRHLILPLISKRWKKPPANHSWDCGTSRSFGRK